MRNVRRSMKYFSLDKFDFMSTTIGLHTLKWLHATLVVMVGSIAIDVLCPQTAALAISSEE